jgi:hypothetical protein
MLDILVAFRKAVPNDVLDLAIEEVLLDQKFQTLLSPLN